MKRQLVWLTILLAHATSVSADDDSTDSVDQSSVWKISMTSLKPAYRKMESTGFMLYTASPDDTLDAAFRCQKGRLYAFVAIKPVSMRDATKPGWHVKRWHVKVAIGNGEFRDEIWASVHDGKVLMARKRSTSRAIFAAARKGTSIHIDPRYGEDVTIDIPADDGRTFRRFEEVCGFVAPRPDGPIIQT